MHVPMDSCQKDMQLEFPTQPEPSGTPDGAARSGPAQHDSSCQHLAQTDFAQLMRPQTPQMQAQLYNETFIDHLSKNENTPHINQSVQFAQRESNKDLTILTAQMLNPCKCTSS
ncbi:hypothetical protein AVEN_211439-1 [Araneus ventricosus]|uniref:Uncharacterized protein n=1 Tax=Araneus ventricosus TaxID=182803 RepID=A0A4Y2K478_ARAVE|nr:hypothetical protein AVEN_238838-1 [Araneus ventricosus]GBM96612.1 hypothetical protein AVEN_54360-1 [Araneus ventricosus]GBM96615.1 hypothetical protein AVEN_106641-1 [Araneus ventricosus]GBM96633.1 hypothetical protein AVEN_211439-1 [Araneus ventricosus]